MRDSRRRARLESSNVACEAVMEASGNRMPEALDNNGDNASRKADAGGQLGRELYFRYAIDPGVARSTSGFAQSERISRFADGPFSLMSEIQQRWGIAISSRPQWPQLHRVWSTSRPIPGLIGADAVIEAPSPFPHSQQETSIPILPASDLIGSAAAINPPLHHQKQTPAPDSTTPRFIGAGAVIDSQPHSPQSQQQLQAPDLTEADAVIEAQPHPRHSQQQTLDPVSTPPGLIQADAANEVQPRLPHARHQAQLPDLQVPVLPVPLLRFPDLPVPDLRTPGAITADVASEVQPRFPHSQPQTHASVAAVTPSTEPKRANADPVISNPSSPASREQHFQAAKNEIHASEPSAQKPHAQAARSVAARSAAPASPAQQSSAPISNPSGVPHTQQPQSAVQRPIVSRAARSSSPIHLQRIAPPDRPAHPQAGAFSGQSTAPRAPERNVPASSDVSAETRGRGNSGVVLTGRSSVETGRDAAIERDAATGWDATIAGQLRSRDLPSPSLTGEHLRQRALDPAPPESSQEAAPSDAVRVKESPPAPAVSADRVSAIPLVQRVLLPADKQPARSPQNPSSLPPARVLLPASVETPRHPSALSFTHQSPPSAHVQRDPDAASAATHRSINIDPAMRMPAGSAIPPGNELRERSGGNVSMPRGLTSSPPALVHSAPPEIHRHQETSSNAAAFTDVTPAHASEEPASVRAADIQGLAPAHGNAAIHVDWQPIMRTASGEPPAADRTGVRTGTIAGPLFPSATIAASGANPIPSTQLTSTAERVFAATGGKRVSAASTPARGVIHRSASTSSGNIAETTSKHGLSAIPHVVHPSPPAAMQPATVIHRMASTVDNHSPLTSLLSNSASSYTHTVTPEAGYRDLFPSSTPTPISLSNSLQAISPAGVPRIQRSAVSPPGPSGAPSSVSTITPPPAATPHGGPQKQQAPDITQLANRVYDLLVRRLSSERQRRGA